MNTMKQHFDVLLTSEKGALIVNDGPPRLLEGTTFVKRGFSVESGSYYYVPQENIGAFLRQLVVLGIPFAFGG